MVDQLTLFPIAPKWVVCFKTCKHFDSHPEYQPDYFPWPPKMKRCRYCNHKYGTSGQQFFLEKDARGSVEMYCIHYERKDA